MEPTQEAETSGSARGSASPVAAQKILALATESLDMLRSVTGVFNQSLEKAEAYVIFSDLLRKILARLTAR
jgi:transcriptional repressor OPI1